MTSIVEKDFAKIMMATPYVNVKTVNILINVNILMFLRKPATSWDVQKGHCMLVKSSNALQLTIWIQINTSVKD